MFIILKLEIRKILFLFLDLILGQFNLMFNILKITELNELFGT